MLIRYEKPARTERAKKVKVDPQLAAAQIIATQPEKYQGLMLIAAQMRLAREAKEQEQK